MVSLVFFCHAFFTWQSAFSRGRRTPSRNPGEIIVFHSKMMKNGTILCLLFLAQKRVVCHTHTWAEQLLHHTIMPRRPGRPRKKKSSKKRLGKATPLPGDLWCQWLQHVLDNGQTWLYVALLLSHLPCLRITEVLRLKAGDFQWKQQCVRIAPLKRQGATVKHMLKGILPALKKLKQKSIRKKRTSKKGCFGVVTAWDVWKWPQDGSYLFPSCRTDAKDPVRNKDTCCKAVARLRTAFFPKGASECGQRVRTHSGRHRMINDLKRAQVPDEIGMVFARIHDRKTYLGYGQINAEQTATILSNNKKLTTNLLKMYDKHLNLNPKKKRTK